MPSKPTRRSAGAALPCLPRGGTPTIRGAPTLSVRCPTLSVRCSGWWMRCPCRCGCRADARELPPLWCGAPAGRERGQWRPPAPRVEVYNTLYGDITQVVVPPTIYEMVHTLGYHRLGDLYTADYRVVGERALKERAPAGKGIPGLRAWLARHIAVLTPLLRAPTPQWQAAPKD